MIDGFEPLHLLSFVGFQLVVLETISAQRWQSLSRGRYLRQLCKGIRDPKKQSDYSALQWTGTYRNCVMYKTKICMFGLSTSINVSMMGLGKDGATKSCEFSEKFHMAFDPPPHFRKIILQILYNGYGRIYAKRAR